MKATDDHQLRNENIIQILKINNKQTKLNYIPNYLA